MGPGPDAQTIAGLEGYLRLVRARFGPVRAILFGSRARGDNLHTSDYDVILVSDCFREIPFRTRLVDASRDWDGDYRLDVLCYTPDELEAKRQQIGLVAEALRYGVELSEAG